MKKNHFVLLLGSYLVLVLPSLLLADERKFKGLSEIYIMEYPPICFTKDNTVTGVATDIVKELMNRLQVNYEIKSLPWKRAYTLLSEGRDKAIYTVTRTEEREPLFKWVGPIINSRLVFFSRPDFALQISNLEDAKKVDKIGVVNGYSVEKLLLRHGFSNVDPVKSESSNPLKLQNKRISLWATVDLVGIYTAKLQGIAPENLKIVYTIEEQEKYIAFSRGVDDEVVQKWQGALDAMKVDGTFQAILTNWQN